MKGTDRLTTGCSGRSAAQPAAEPERSTDNDRRMCLLQGVTLAIAVLGAALGVINTWHALDRTRVKLRVRPKHAIPVCEFNSRLTFCIELTIGRSARCIYFQENL
jgi:hypothetical protein